MRQLTLSIIINAITDGARQGLQQTQYGLNELRSRGEQAATRLQGVFTLLWAQMNGLGSRALFAISNGFDHLKSVGVSTWNALSAGVSNNIDAAAEFAAKLGGIKGGLLGLLAFKKADFLDLWGGFAVRAGLLGVQVNASKNFESAFADVKKVVSGTNEELDKLERRIKRIASQEIPFKLTEIAEIVKSGGQLGQPISELEDYTRLIGQAATAFEILPQEAGIAVGGLTNIYQESLDQIALLLDQINVLGDSTAATERDILDVMRFVGGEGKRFGLLKSETAALVATMLSLQKPPEIARTSLLGLFSALSTGEMRGKAFHASLQRMGLSAEQLAVDIQKNPKQALLDFLATLGRFDKLSQSQLLSGLFGLGTDAGSIGDLAGALADLEKNIANVQNTSNVSGSMLRTFAARADTAENKLQLLKNAVEVFNIEMGNPFLAPLKAATDLFHKFMDSLGRFAADHPVLSAVVRIIALVQSLSIVLNILTTVLPLATRALLQFLAVLAGTPFGGFAKNILAATVAVTLLTGVVGGVNSLLLSTAIALGLVGYNAVKAFQAAGASATVFGSILTGVRTTVSSLLLTFGGGWVKVVIIAITSLIVAYTNLQDKLVSVGGINAKISEAMSAAWRLLARKIGEALAVARNYLAQFGDGLFRLVGINQQTWDSIADKINRFVNDAPGVIKAWVNVLIGALVALKDNAAIRLEAFVDILKVKFKGAVDLAKAAGRDIKDALAGQFDTANIDVQLAKNTTAVEGIRAKADQQAEAANKSAFSADYVGNVINGVDQYLDDLSHDIAEEINRDRKSNQPPVAPPEIRAENTGQSLPPPVGDEKTLKALSQATLDDQLSAIKTRQDALKSSHDLELKQLETRFNQEKLHLEQQVVEQVITEQQKNEQTLALTKELDAKKITLERAFIEQSSQLEKADRVAKIQAEQAQAPDDAYTSLINAAQQTYRLPDGLVRAVMQVESGGNPNAVSPAGASGLMQLMPDTARGLGVTDVFDPKQNIEGGAKLLRELLDTFNGDVNKALAAYNATPTKVKAAQGDISKLPAETQAYVPKVLAEMQNPTGRGSAEERQASMVKIKTLNNELVTIEQDKVAKLKSLGVDEQNATIEQSTEALAIRKQHIEQQNALKEQQLQAEHDAALDAVASQEQAAQQELDLGHITASEHLDRLKNFAANRLAIELKLLEEKRKLLKDDKLALAQNLSEQQALMRKFGLDVQNINNDLATQNKAVFEGMFAPFQNALQQMTNGVLTGQQTIANAVRNAANSILVSYASTFIQQRVMQAAQWAWQLTGIEVTGAKEKALKEGDVIWAAALWAGDKARLAGQWAWETLGFAKKEATKQTISQHGVITETLLSAKKKVVWAAEWAWETVGFGLKEARKRVLSLATNAFETVLSAKKKIVLAAEWVWETLGFGAKEATKVGSKAASETAQSGAQLAGDAIRTASAVTAEGTKKAVTASTAAASIMSKAYDAAAGVYSSLSAIPFVGWILAPVAAAATFAVVAGWSVAAGSAKGGEWQVDKDGSPYILHEKESVLPAGVADNFRKIINIVKSHVFGEPEAVNASASRSDIDDSRKSLIERFAGGARSLTESLSNTVAGQFNRSSARHDHTDNSRTSLTERSAGTLSPHLNDFISNDLPALFASGALPRHLALPAELINFERSSAQHAQTIAAKAGQRDARLTEQMQTLLNVQLAQPAAPQQRRIRDELRVTTISAKDLFREHSGTLVKELKREARRFNQG